MRDSVDFISMAKEWITPDHHKMISFDVISLFTNVPKDLVTKVAKKGLEMDEHLKERTDLTVAKILILSKFCLDAT